jgi:hypothetical protein
MKERFKLVAVVSRHTDHVERIIFRRNIGPCLREEVIRMAAETVAQKETPDAKEYWLVPGRASVTHSRRIPFLRLPWNALCLCCD